MRRVVVVCGAAERHRVLVERHRRQTAENDGRERVGARRKRRLMTERVGHGVIVLMTAPAAMTVRVVQRDLDLRREPIARRSRFPRARARSASPGCRSRSRSSIRSMPAPWRCTLSRNPRAGLPAQSCGTRGVAAGGHHFVGRRRLGRRLEQQCRRHRRRAATPSTCRSGFRSRLVRAAASNGWCRRARRCPA